MVPVGGKPPQGGIADLRFAICDWTCLDVGQIGNRKSAAHSKQIARWHALTAGAKPRTGGHEPLICGQPHAHPAAQAMLCFAAIARMLS